MGCRCTFQCPACEYQAEVSGGGDGGFISAITTIVCHDCRELFDIVTGYHKEKAGKKAPPFRCPKGRAHRIEEWEAGGECPRCGRVMENKGIACMWD
jgi:hypothetical protein